MARHFTSEIAMLRRIVEVVEPAISATQIKGMSDLHAYLVQRGFKNNHMVIGHSRSRLSICRKSIRPL